MFKFQPFESSVIMLQPFEFVAFHVDMPPFLIMEFVAFTLDMLPPLPSFWCFVIRMLWSVIVIVVLNVDMSPLPSIWCLMWT